MRDLIQERELRGMAVEEEGRRWQAFAAEVADRIEQIHRLLASESS